MSAEPQPLELVELDIDTRCHDLWALLDRWLRLEDNRPAEEFVPSLLRAAYGAGYVDALREDRDGERGALLRAHGYELL